MDAGTRRCLAGNAVDAARELLGFVVLKHSLGKVSSTEVRRPAQGGRRASRPPPGADGAANQLIVASQFESVNRTSTIVNPRPEKLSLAQLSSAGNAEKHKHNPSSWPTC